LPHKLTGYIFIYQLDRHLRYEAWFSHAQPSSIALCYNRRSHTTIPLVPAHDGRRRSRHRAP